jgi:hypothetical protein
MASHRKTDLVGAAEPGAQFIQLQMREPEGAERALVQHLRMRGRARQPRGDGGLMVTEDPLRGGRVEPFGKPQRAPLRPDGKGFSDGTTQCRVER